MDYLIFTRSGDIYTTKVCKFAPEATNISHGNGSTQTFFKCHVEQLSDGAYRVFLSRREGVIRIIYLLKEDIERINLYK